MDLIIVRYKSEFQFRMLDYNFFRFDVGNKNSPKTCRLREQSVDSDCVLRLRILTSTPDHNTSVKTQVSSAVTVNSVTFVRAAGYDAVSELAQC